MIKRLNAVVVIVAVTAILGGRSLAAGAAAETDGISGMTTTSTTTATTDASSTATTSSTTTTSGTTTSDASGAASRQKTASRHSSLSKKVAGVVSGVFIGTPVCAVRGTIDEDKFAVTDMTGGNKQKKNIKAAVIFWAPFSAVAGVLQAPFWAVNNSLVHYDQPFSPQQFSLQQRTGSYVKELKNEQKYEPESRDIQETPVH